MFCVCSVDVHYLTEDDQDISKHVGVDKLCVKTYNFNISESVGFLCELFVNART
jgi:hypothetical protein